MNTVRHKRLGIVAKDHILVMTTRWRCFMKLEQPHHAASYTFNAIIFFYFKDLTRDTQRKSESLKKKL